MERTPTKSLTAFQLSQHSASVPSLNTSAEETNSDFFSNITRRVKRKCNIVSADSNCNTANMDELKELIIKSISKQDAKFESLSSAMTSLLAQNEEIHKSVEFMSQKYDDLVTKLDTLQRENRDYKSQVATLETRIELLERNTKVSAVEIKNIPKSTNEKKDTLQSLVKNVGNVLEINIQDSDIRDIYRIKTKEGQSGPIIAEFSTVTKKDQLLKAARNYNKVNKEQPLNTLHLHHPGPSMPIYMAESLTKKAKHLHYLARQFKKDYHYHSCWTSYGKIYLRKQDGAPAIHIATEEDLVKLK